MSDLFASVRREGLVYYGIIVCVNLINIGAPRPPEASAHHLTDSAGFFASGIASSVVNSLASLD